MSGPNGNHLKIGNGMANCVAPGVVGNSKPPFKRKGGGTVGNH